MASQRVIDALRKMFPGKWRYEWPRWVHEDGWDVTAYAELDGDDDSFRTIFIRSDTGQRVYPHCTIFNFEIAKETQP